MAKTIDATWECRDCANQFDATARPYECPGCGGSQRVLFRVSAHPDDDMCRCGHAREDHDTRGCDVVIRGDGLGCRCRGFRLDDGSERNEDNGRFYGHPGDHLRGLE